MLLYIMLGCFLPLTTTEVVSTAQPLTSKQAETADQMPTFVVGTGPSTTVQPRTEVSENLTLAATMRSAFSASVASATPVQNMSNLETTNYTTNGVQTVQEGEKLIVPTTSNMDATATTTVSAISTVVKTSDMPTSIVQSGESSFLTASSMQATISSGIASTRSEFLSSQTIQMKEQTTILAVASERPTTNVYPTAKLSATTQNTPTRLFKTSKASTGGPFVSIQFDEANEKENDRKKSLKHGKIVAGLIGGALIAMMIAFLVILYKKHKLKKQQIATTEWAGPTPFLETGTDNGHVTLRSSNRISLTSFLPQRLSKRLSLLQEVGEEMQELTPGTTFGGKEVKKDISDEKNGKKRATNGNSGNSRQTEDVILVNETSQDNGKAKLNEGETAKSEEPENGQIQSKEWDNVQAQTNEENGESENTPTQPATDEEPPEEPEAEDAESNAPDVV